MDIDDNDDASKRPADSSPEGGKTRKQLRTYAGRRKGLSAREPPPTTTRNEPKLSKGKKSGAATRQPLAMEQMPTLPPAPGARRTRSATSAANAEAGPSRR
jgi:hypothetical protein